MVMRKKSVISNKSLESLENKKMETERLASPCLEFSATKMDFEINQDYNDKLRDSNVTF